MSLHAQVIIRRIVSAGGLPLRVGGCVRDKEMGFVPKDIDIEIYKLGVDEIIRALEGLKLDVVGRAFGVIKVFIEGEDFDLSIPRRENKCGVGHKGFQILPDPTMSPKEAAARRDFTINSLAETPEGVTLDFFDGLQDIRSRTLRATSSQFSEDPLRVLRGVQFAARFGMTMDSPTIAACRTMSGEFSTLARERVWGEFRKLMLKGSHIRRGLSLLKETHWLGHFPELQALDGCPQDPLWHPEGDVFVHTQHVCDAAAEIATRDGLAESERLILMFAALGHDLGKATTTVQNEAGRWTAPGHAAAGVTPTRSFLESIGAPNYLIEAVLPLVAEHMAHVSVPEPNPRQVRRLAVRLNPASMETWGRLVEADHSGRPPLSKGNPGLQFVELARQLAVLDSSPQPILMGRHLIEHLQMTPGRHLGAILQEAYQVQLDAGWNCLEDALDWARNRVQL